MFYPPEMSEQEIMEFEYEINRQIDIERGEGQFWAVNAELQVIAHDELERDWDESYEPEGSDYPDPDSAYEDQYELEEYY